MHFKLLLVFCEDENTKTLMEAAREAGATGSTLIKQAVGEGLEESTTFFGLTLETQRDVILFLVEEHMSRKILERLSEVGQFDNKPGTGIALQLDVEDAVGVSHQIQELSNKVEGEL